jgi:hypothetical protein
MPLDNDSTGPGLIDVLDRVLDKGIVIDAAVRVSVVGVELLSVDARVVVASIETYLRHADALAYTAMAAAPAKALPDEPVLYVEPVDAALPPEPTPVALDASATPGEVVTLTASATPGEVVTLAPEAESPLPEGQPPPLPEGQPPPLPEAQEKPRDDA